MKKTISCPKMMLLLGVISITLFSFRAGFGGEGYEVYLNNKVILQQFGKQLDNPTTISLEQADPNDQLLVKYYRCGTSGDNRVFTIRDAKNKILKEWRFASGEGRLATMTCKVKDILSLPAARSEKLKLYYTSTEVPAGRLLASLAVNTSSTAKVR